MRTGEVPAEEINLAGLEPRIWTEEQDITAHQIATTTEQRVELLILNTEQELDATEHTAEADVGKKHELKGVRSALSSLTRALDQIEGRGIMSGQALAEAMFEVVMSERESLSSDEQSLLSDSELYSDTELNKRRAVISGKKQALEIAGEPLAEAIGLIEHDLEPEYAVGLADTGENLQANTENHVAATLSAAAIEVENDDFFLDGENDIHRDKVRQLAESLLAEFSAALENESSLSRLKSRLGSDLQDRRKKILKAEEDLRQNWLKDQEKADLTLSVSVLRSEVRFLNFVYDRI